MATLVGHWFRNGAIADASGSGNNATFSKIVGGTDAALADGYRRGKCLDIPAGAYGQVPWHASLDVDTAFTICGWIYPRDLGSRRVLFSTRDSAAAGTRWGLEIGNPGSVARSMAIVSSPGGFICLTDTVLTTNEWQFVSFKTNGVAEQFQRNGTTCSLVNDYPRNWTLTSQTQRWIGAANADSLSASVMYDGLIGDLMLWGGVLTDRELATIRIHGAAKLPSNIIPAVWP